MKYTLKEHISFLKHHLDFNRRLKAKTNLNLNGRIRNLILDILWKLD